VPESDPDLPRHETTPRRVAFSAPDMKEVSYELTVAGPGVFVHGSSATTTGTVSTTFRVRPRTGVRTLRLTVVASDPVGSETKVIRQLRRPAWT
jgi:hypothetical protein